MQSSRILFPKAAALLGLALAALGTAGVAQARDVYWSVGIDAAPGVSVGVANHRQPVYVAPQPVYVQPAPVYVQPAPVYMQPYPVYAPPRVVYTQPQVVYPGRSYYVQPAPVYHAPPGHWKHAHKHHKKHWKHNRHWDD